MKYLVFAVLCFAAVVEALGCSCSKLSFDEQMAIADSIFLGRVESIELLEGKIINQEHRTSTKMHGDVPRIVRFRPVQSWKGAHGDRVEVITGGGRADCGFPFRKSGWYLVYGVQGREGLYTDVCVRTDDYECAIDDDLARLGPPRWQNTEIQPPRYRPGEPVTLGRCVDSPMARQAIDLCWPVYLKSIELDLLISASGSVDRIEVRSCTPRCNEAFKVEAMNAIRKARFQPASRRGKRTAVQIDYLTGSGNPFALLAGFSCQDSFEEAVERALREDRSTVRLIASGLHGWEHAYFFPKGTPHGEFDRVLGFRCEECRLVDFQELGNQNVVVLTRGNAVVQLQAIPVNTVNIRPRLLKTAFAPGTVFNISHESPYHRWLESVQE